MNGMMQLAYNETALEKQMLPLGVLQDLGDGLSVLSARSLGVRYGRFTKVEGLDTPNSLQEVQVHAEAFLKWLPSEYVDTLPKRQDIFAWVTMKVWREKHNQGSILDSESSRLVADAVALGQHARDLHKAVSRAVKNPDPDSYGAGMRDAADILLERTVEVRRRLAARLGEVEPLVLEVMDEVA